MKKLYLILPIIVWIILFGIDLSLILFQKQKPMYFRAWEYVLNEGKDSYYVPFKPFIHYDGKLQGDLLKLANFLPEKGSITNQIFNADEYGFRNRKHVLQKPVEAVIMGTSFVGGAHETQKNLIPDILIDKYGINAYNYATLPLQHFWEDTRFIKHPPKYVVIVADESEILQNTWVEVLQDSNNTHTVPRWNSYTDWYKKNAPDITYDYLTQYLSRFSLVRYELNQVYLHVLNFALPRQLIVDSTDGAITYDPKSDFLFIDVGSYNPLYTKKSKVSIDQTIQTLLKTKKVLQERNITLIVAVMPSKASLYFPAYKDKPLKDKSLYYLEKNLDKYDITNIKLLDIMTKYAHSPDHLLYYKDDSHWTSEVNYYIADQIQKLIK